MANNNPSPNARLTAYYAAQQGVNPSVYSQGATHVNMGETAMARTYIPMTGNQTQVTALGNARRATQMWTVDAANGLYDYLPAPMKQLVFDYTAARLGHAKFNDDTMRSYYNKAIQGAAQQALVMGGDPIDLPTYMSNYVEKFIADGGTLGGSGSGGSGGGGAGGGPSTTVQLNLTNQSDAAVLVDQALTQYLGREATAKEKEKFWGVLNGAQQQNPNVSQNSGGQNASIVNSGGVNPQQAAKEFAMSRKGAAEYMANTQYADWLFEKIAADPTEGIASGL
jgi:hypothetical protein